MDGSVESRARLLALVRGYRISQAIYVVTRLGIPDLLADGPQEIDELTRATGSHPPSLRRVLLLLAGVGVLDKVGPRRFGLTEVAALLRTGVPGSLRPSVLLWLDESHWRPWGHLLHTVRTGETAFHHVHGAGVFDYLAGHPEVAAVLYPGLPSHPGHQIAARQMTGGFGGMLSIRLAGGAERALALLAAVRVFKRATSLGGVESLMEHRRTMEGPSSPVPADLLRLSVGIEDPADLLADLDAALDAARGGTAAAAPPAPAAS